MSTKNNSLPGNEPSYVDEPRATPPDAVTDSAFDLFPKLPLELRLLVWSHSLPTDRIVEIVFSTDRQSAEWHLSSEPEPKLKACCDPIPHLFACRESRFLGLKKYTLRRSPGFKNPFYLDSDSDIFMIPSFEMVDEIWGTRSDGLGHIQLRGCFRVLAIDSLHRERRSSSWRPYLHSEEYVQNDTFYDALVSVHILVDGLKNLRKLIILPPKTHFSWQRAAMLGKQLKEDMENQQYWLDLPSDRRLENSSRTLPEIVVPDNSGSFSPVNGGRIYQ